MNVLNEKSLKTNNIVMSEMFDDESEKKARNAEILTNGQLASYISEFNEDVKLSLRTLREKSLMCSSIWAKWLQYLYKEKENLQRISDTKKKVMQKRMAESKNVDSVLRMKNEDKITESDETMKKLADLGRKTQTNIEYIERALNILQNFGYQIKNCIDVYKLNFEH